MTKYLPHHQANAWNRYYGKMEHASKHLAETNDCAVIALAIACKLSYERIHRLCTSYSRIPQTGTSEYIINSVLWECHLKTIDVTQQFPNRPSVNIFHKHRDPKNTYLVYTKISGESNDFKQHVFATTTGMDKYLYYSNDSDIIVRIQQVVIDFDKILSLPI